MPEETHKLPNVRFGYINVMFCEMFFLTMAALQYIVQATQDNYCMSLHTVVILHTVVSLHFTSKVDVLQYCYFQSLRT